MEPRALCILICLGLATTAAAQGAQGGKSESSAGASKTSLSEVRKVVHELQGRTEKLRDLMEQYRSLVEQRPQKADDAQLAKWSAAIDRLMKRVEGAHAAVVETTKQLDQADIAKLPTALAKDAANARNEAEAQRTAAEQALTKNKSTARAAKPTKPAKQAPASEKPAPTLPEGLEDD